MTTAYTTDHLRLLWSDDTTLSLWRDIEIEVLRAQIEYFGWPTERLYPATERPVPSVYEWRRQTHSTGHEFVAFLDAWDVPWVHIGLTSSDVIDTALGIRLRRSALHLHKLAVGLRNALADQAWEHRATPRLGRTHGQAATETAWGYRLADLAHAVDRCVWRLADVADQVGVAKISGPVGTYTYTPREVESAVAAAFGLRPAGVATQIVMRDGLATWAGVLATTAAVCEAVALEVRLGSHAQVGELREADGGRRGSSAMPHKSNPIVSERVCGLARLARSSFEPLVAGVAQFHERDLAHSSVERSLLPQLSGATAVALELTTQVVSELQAYPLTMLANLRKHPVDTETHAAQTALLLAGASHRQAQARVRAAHLTSSNVAQFWDQIGLPRPESGDAEYLDSIVAARQFGNKPTSPWKEQ